MPNIRSSADLRNSYNDISTYCHSYNEPVFITKNGKGDLAVMSMETYEEQMVKADIYHKVLIAEKQIQNDELLDGEKTIDNLCEKYGS